MIGLVTDHDGTADCALLLARLAFYCAAKFVCVSSPPKMHSRDLRHISCKQIMRISFILIPYLYEIAYGFIQGLFEGLETLILIPYLYEIAYGFIQGLFRLSVDG